MMFGVVIVVDQQRLGPVSQVCKMLKPLMRVIEWKVLGGGLGGGIGGEGGVEDWIVWL